MKYKDVQTRLENYVQDFWTGTQTAFENVPFDTELYEEFARFSVQFGDARLQSLGTRCYRVPGVAFMSIFVKPGVGSARMSELADAATSLFAGVSIAPGTPATAPVIQMLAPSVAKLEADNKGWVQCQVSIPFYYDVEV